MRKEVSNAKGRRNKITGQIGEYLASAELARRGYVVTTFAGNVPEFDIIAVDDKLRSFPIQVKAIRGGSWQFDAREYIDITLHNNIQTIHGKKRLRHPDLIFIMVLIAGSYGEDKFYLVNKSRIRNIIFKKYSAWLKEKKGRRPKNPESFHCIIAPKDLAFFENNWGLIHRTKRRS